MSVVKDQAETQKVEREKVRRLCQKCRERESQDARASEALWKRVLSAVRPFGPRRFPRPERLRSLIPAQLRRIGICHGPSNAIDNVRRINNICSEDM